MSDVELLHGGDAAQTRDLALDGLELLAGLEHAQPGLGILGIGHIVVGMIAGHHHQGPQDHGLVARLGDGFDDVFAGGLFGLALHGADEHVLVAERLHLSLHLGVGDLGGVRGAVAHEHEGHALLFGLGELLEAGGLNGSGDHGLGDGLLVGVDVAAGGADLTEQRLGNGHGLKFVLVLLQRFHQLVVLGAVHQVGGLDDKVLHAVGHGALQSLLHVVDLLAVAGLDVVDDDLRGEGAADGPFGEGRGERVLDALDVRGAAVVERGAEAHDQQLVLADLIGVAGVVLGGVAGVAAEVIGLLDQLLLRGRQSVPGGLGLGALGVGVLGPFLHLNAGDQLVHRCGGRLILRTRLQLPGGTAGKAAHTQDHTEHEQHGDEFGCFLHPVFLLKNISVSRLRDRDKIKKPRKDNPPRPYFRAI